MFSNHGQGAIVYMQLSTFCTQLLKVACTFLLFARNLWKFHVTFDFLHVIFTFRTMWNLKVACTFWVQIMNCDLKQLMTPHLRKLHAILRFHSQLYETYKQISKLRNTYWWKLHAKSWKFRVKSENLHASFQRCVYFSKVPCKFQKFVAKSNFWKLLAKSRNVHTTFKSLVQFSKVACKKSKVVCKLGFLTHMARYTPPYSC